jgi:hypothetical protein
VVTEQQFIGLQEAPRPSAVVLLERLGTEKRIRIPFNPRALALRAAGGQEKQLVRPLADMLIGAMVRVRSTEPDRAKAWRTTHGQRGLSPHGVGS